MQNASTGRRIQSQVRDILPSAFGSFYIVDFDGAYGRDSAALSCTNCCGACSKSGAIPGIMFSFRYQVAGGKYCDQVAVACVHCNYSSGGTHVTGAAGFIDCECDRGMMLSL